MNNTINTTKTKEEKELEEQFMINNMRVNVYTGMSLTSLYAAALAKHPHCRMEEKKTLNNIVRETDNRLLAIERLKKQRKGSMSVQVHNEILDSNSSFIIELIEMGNLVVSYGDVRSRVLKKLEKIIIEENGRAYNNQKALENQIKKVK